MENVILEDFFYGFAIAQVTAFVWGAWSLAVGVVSGICWVGGGQGWLGTKAWRRIGVPILVSLPFGLLGHALGCGISGSLQMLWHTVGYGEPSSNPPDEGSWLGRIFGKWTRLVWFLILGLTLIPLGIK